MAGGACRPHRITRAGALFEWLLFPLCSAFSPAPFRQLAGRQKRLRDEAGRTFNRLLKEGTSRWRSGQALPFFQKPDTAFLPSAGILPALLFTPFLPRCTPFGFLPSPCPKWRYHLSRPLHIPQKTYASPLVAAFPLLQDVSLYCKTLHFIFCRTFQIIAKSFVHFQLISKYCRLLQKISQLFVPKLINEKQ
jgi:hypothetical protein